MSILTLSTFKWAQAKQFFNENCLDEKCQFEEKNLFYLKGEKGRVWAVSTNTFLDNINEHIELYVSENGDNYVSMPLHNPDICEAFSIAMKQANIQIKNAVIEHKPVFELCFPTGFNTDPNAEKKIKKIFNLAYEDILFKKLLNVLLFTDKDFSEDRQTLYRGIFSAQSPAVILKNVHESLLRYITEKNAEKAALEIEKLLSRMMLADNGNNVLSTLTEHIIQSDNKSPERTLKSEYVHRYLEIIDQLSIHMKDTPEKRSSFEKQLQLSARQVSAYNQKKNELLEKLKTVEESSVFELDKAVHSDLAGKISSPILDLYSEQFSSALKNKAYTNYLNIKVEDFYPTVWSKRSDNTSLSGESITKIVKDFNCLSARVAKDIVFAISYHHQVNVMHFYTQALSKSIEIADFNSAQAILAGLNHVSVGRFGYLKTLLGVKQILDEAEIIFSPEHSMKNYRAAIKLAGEQGKTVIPFIGAYLKDLTFSEEGNPTLLADSSLNVNKVSLMGKMVTYIDECLRQIYRAKPIQTTLSIKSIDDVVLDEEKTYQASLNGLLRTTPDISKCKTVEELAKLILINNKLPLYLNFIYDQKHYILPKAYEKLLKILDDKINKKNFSIEEAKLALSLVHKIELHASSNYMATEKIEKRIHKINVFCIERIKSIDLSFSALSLGPTVPPKSVKYN